MAPVLGYCDFRGLAGSLRSLLYYTGTEFEDKKYHMGPPPDFDRSEWLADKPKLGLDFPNFPFYVDGNLKMTQSLAILRHLGRKHGLTSGDTEEELCRADIALQQITDVLLGLGRLAYNPNFDTEKVIYIKDLPEKLGPFSKFMGSNPWLLGENLTYVDFLFYELLDFHRFLAPDVVNSFDNFKDFIKRFESIPTIEKYHKSGQYIKWPLFSPHAKFGGSPDPPSF